MNDSKGWRVDRGPSSRLRERVRVGQRCVLALALCALTLFSAALDAQSDSTFVMSTNDPSRDPSPFIGNGHFGVVVPPLGLGASPSIVAGLFENGAGDVPRIAASPAWNAIDVFDGTRWLTAVTPSNNSLHDYEQSIDMRAGVARTSYEWVDGAARTSVRTQTFVSRANPHLAAVRLELTSRAATRMRVRFALAGWPPPNRLALATLTRADPSWGPAELWYPGHLAIRSRTVTLAPGGAWLTMTSTPDGRTTMLAQVASISWARNLPGMVVHKVARGDTAMVEVAFDASPGVSYAFTDHVSMVSSLQSPQPLVRATSDAVSARTVGYEALAAKNADAWRKRWETDIEIDGDPALQRVIRSMLFYLLCSADSGTGFAIPPMGLSGAGYYGHVFWDSDTWMFPSLVLTHPDVAHSLASFRARTLGSAQANARANGFRGAMYPWEADDLGHETTPHFAAQNASSEIHVNGDVALAQWQYFQATGDSVWLAREGFPVIRATADFWVSRATYDSVRARYDINNVVSVSEGMVGVNDDAYTNSVAKRNLEIATAASARLGERADPRWTAVAAKLHMPLDSATESYRTYEGAPDSTLGEVTPMLSYPLAVPMSNRAKRAHLDQAVARLGDEAGGAMMGITLLSVDAAELGDSTLVDSLLPYSYKTHLQGPFLMLSETPTNHAVNFLTGAGGFLQQVIFGYTGLRLSDDGLAPSFAPVLPRHITRLVLHAVHVRGKTYDVVVDAKGRRIVPHVADRRR